MRWAYLVAGLGLATPAWAGSEETQRAQEAALLHQRPSLREIEVWNRKTHVWQPLALPRDKVLVVNLWSRSCIPCLKELPVLAGLVKNFAPTKEIAFLLVADGPDEMTREKVEDFWEHPSFDLPGQDCPGQGRRVIQTNTRCSVDVPELDPARTTSDRLHQTLGVNTKPVTLVIDPRGTVRQAFVGEITHRVGAVDSALRRLLEALAAEKNGTHTATQLRKT